MNNNGNRAIDFIGRQPELAVLTAALDDALAGRGQMVMLAGEPGIGKTRLSQELASRAESLGAQVLWGWCYEHSGAPPYWPYVQPIRAYIEETDAEQLSSQLGSGGPAIAEIVPEIREKLPDLGQSITVEPEQARFRLFDSVATFLKNAAQAKPLVFVVDDLHWADSSSLLMLEFLAREISATPILILGTYRDVEITASHSLSQLLGNLVRERHYRGVQLKGLTLQEVGEAVEASKGVNLSGNVLQAIHSRTEGNPLFLNELVELVNPMDVNEDRAWADLIPNGVRDAIGNRLNRLSPDCLQVLRKASVMGRAFDVSLLSSLDPDVGFDESLAALEEALGTRVIAESGPGEFQFAHALIQEVLYDEISSIARLQTHAAIGTALERIHGSNLEAHAAEIARHFAEAGAALGLEKLAHYSLMAGERALSTHAYEDALTHFKQGLAARDIDLLREGAAPDEEAADLMFGLARAQSATGVGVQLAEASEIIKRAFEYYVASGSVHKAVAAAELRIAPPAFVLPGVTDLIERALALVPDDSREAGRLLTRYGGILGVADLDFEGAHRALERAKTIAVRENDVGLEIQALGYAALVSGLHVKWQDSLSNGLRAIELDSGGHDNQTTGVRFWTAVTLLSLGDLEAARPHALVLRNLAELQSTSRIFFGRSLGPIANLARLEGNWHAGRQHSDRGLEVSPSDPTLLETRILLEYETGDPGKGSIFLDRLIEAVGRPGPDQFLACGRTSMAIAAASRITGLQDRLEVGDEAAQTVLSASNLSPRFVLNATIGSALLAVIKGDRTKAKKHYSDLQWQKGTMVWAVISVDRLLGLLCQVMDNTAQAGAHFEDALVFCRKAGYRPELAWTCCDYADTLLARKGDGDAAKAVSLLNESLSLSGDLGMGPLGQRVTSRLESVGQQSSQASTLPDGLTQREVEILRLICGGKTDREIADELFISFRTVGNHVRNILNKTDTANRTEAATYAALHGIVSGDTTD